MITCCLISIISSKQKRGSQNHVKPRQQLGKTKSHCSHSSKRSTDTRPLRAALEKLSIESICLLQVDRSLHRRSTGTESATTTTTAKARPATLKKKHCCQFCLHWQQEY
jgi:hypothetical protein